MNSHTTRLPLTLGPMPTIDHVDERRLAILDAIDGSISVVGVSQETISMDPASGARYFRHVTTALRTKCGRLIHDATVDHVYACSICRTQPLAVQAVCECARCRRIICYACTKGPVCATCAPSRWKERLSWLFSL